MQEINIKIVGSPFYVKDDVIGIINQYNEFDALCSVEEFLEASRELVWVLKFLDENNVKFCFGDADEDEDNENES